MFHDQKFYKNSLLNRLLNSTSFSPLTAPPTKWQKLVNAFELLSNSAQNEKSRTTHTKKRSLKAELSITPLLAALLAACGSDTEYIPVGGSLAPIDDDGGSGDDDGDGDDTPSGPLPFNLYVVDGPILNAVVYVDSDENGRYDRGDDFLGVTNADGLLVDGTTGELVVAAQYAGATFFVDIGGATDVFTGEQFPNNSTDPLLFYRAVAHENGGADVVVSPISTLIEALRDDDPTQTNEQILELIFGPEAITLQITMDDINDTNNFIPPINDTPKPVDSREALAEKIASTSIQLQVLIEQEGGDLDAVLTAVTDGFDAATDLTPTSQTEVAERIAQSRARASGDPIAIPLTGLEITEDGPLRLSISVDEWGFHDPLGNVENFLRSTYLHSVNIVSITDENGDAVGGDLVHIETGNPDIRGERTIYGAGDTIEFLHLHDGNLFFRPDNNFIGNVSITYTGYDGEASTNQAVLEINVTADLWVTESGTRTEAKVTAHGIVFTLKEGGVSDGITFATIENAAAGVFGVYDYSAGDVIAISELDTSLTLQEIIDNYNADAESSYTASLAVGANATDTVTLTALLNGGEDSPVALTGGDSPDTPSFYANSEFTPITVDADLVAGGDFVFGDEGDIFTDFTVFVGNINADPANITIEISVDATSDDIMGDARNSNGDAYGSFVFTRAGDGTVTWVYTLDDNAANELSVNEIAMDSVFVQVGDEATDIRQITVRIYGTGDAPEITTNGGDAYALPDIVENTTDDIVTIAATDTDVNDVLTYSLGGTDADDFNIDEDGVVTWAQTPDYETPTDSEGDNEYSVTVTVADAGGNQDTIALTLTVTDENEAPVLNFMPEVLTLFNAITLTPKTGQTPSGVSFVASDDVTLFELRLSVGADNINIIEYNSEAGGFFLGNLVEQFMNNSDSLYNVDYINEANKDTDIKQDDFSGMSFGMAPVDIFIDGNGDAVDENGDAADGSATGTLLFDDADAGDTLANLQVFVDDEENDSDSTQTELSVDATSDDIMGDARNSNGDAYGSFAFTRAGDGTVSWTYTIDDDAVAGIETGEVVMDSLWMWVQDDDDANSTVRKITVFINGVNSDPVADTTDTNYNVTGTVVEHTLGRGATGEFVVNDPDGTIASYTVEAGETVIIEQRTIIDGGVEVTVPVEVVIPEQRFGTVTIAADGKWFYVLDNSNILVHALGDNGQLTDYITIRATDNEGGYVEDTVTITINGQLDLQVDGTANDDNSMEIPLGYNSQTNIGTLASLRTIQGGNGDDFLGAARAGDIYIVSDDDNDTLDLADGRRDKVFYQIASTANALAGSDGNYTINNFKLVDEFQDNLMFVDTDGTPLGGLEALLDLTKGNNPQLTVSLISGGDFNDVYTGFIFEFTQTGTTLTLNFSQEITEGGKNEYFERNGVDANGQLNDNAIEGFLKFFGDNFSVLPPGSEGGVTDVLGDAGQGDLLAGGYGDDTIILGEGSDTVVYRITSLDDSLRADDGGDTVIDFTVTGINQDRLVFTDTDGVSVGNLAGEPLEDLSALLDLIKGDAPPLTVSLIKDGDDYTGFTFEFTAASRDDGPNGIGDVSGTTLTINFRSTMSEDDKNTNFGSDGIDTNNQLTEAGIDDFITNFGDNFEVIPMDELGFDII